MVFNHKNEIHTKKELRLDLIIGEVTDFNFFEYEKYIREISTFAYSKAKEYLYKSIKYNLEDFKIIKGEDKLKLYQFHTKVAKHYFCSDCGIYTHHQRRKAPNEFGYNLACIEGIDLARLGDVPMTDGKGMSVEPSN